MGASVGACEGLLRSIKKERRAKRPFALSTTSSTKRPTSGDTLPGTSDVKTETERDAAHYRPLEGGGFVFQIYFPLVVQRPD